MSMKEVRRQILDENKRKFSITEYGNDPDIFFTECVDPLRAMHDVGAIENLEEIMIDTIGGGEKVVGVAEIIGALNLNLL